MGERRRCYSDDGGYCRMGLLGLALMAGCLLEFVSAFGAFAESASPPVVSAPSASPERPQIPSPDALKKWRAAMAHVHPTKSGCFKSVYPSPGWQEIPCVRPKRRFLPRNGRRPAIIGGSGSDLSALVAGNITSATGSFGQDTNVTGETGNTYDGGCTLVASNV